MIDDFKEEKQKRGAGAGCKKEEEIIVKYHFIFIKKILSYIRNIKFKI